AGPRGGDPRAGVRTSRLSSSSGETMSQPVRYGGKNYKRRSHTSTLLELLMQRYREEGVVMPYTLEDFEREYKGVVIQGIPAEERLKGMSAEEILKAIPKEEILKGLPADELLAALPPETREALARLLKAEGPPSKAD